MITKENYEKWCEAMDKTNQELIKLHKDRLENKKWLCDEIKNFFESFDGLVLITVMAQTDGSIIRVVFKGQLNLQDDRLREFPIPFSVCMEDNNLVILIKTEIMEISL